MHICDVTLCNGARAHLCVQTRALGNMYVDLLPAGAQSFDSDMQTAIAHRAELLRSLEYEVSCVADYPHIDPVQVVAQRWRLDARGNYFMVIWLPGRPLNRETALSLLVLLWQGLGDDTFNLYAELKSFHERR